LGATRWRVVAANFQETLLVCTAVTGLAFLVEIWVRPLIARFIPAVNNAGPELLEAGPVLVVFGIVICLLVSFAVSAASGLRFEIEGLAGTLAQGGRSSESRSARGYRVMLGGGQLAIVLTLLTVSGMVGRSFLSAVCDLILASDAEGLATVQVSLPGSQRDTLAAISNLTAQVAAIPGVTGVTFAAESPGGRSSVFDRDGGSRRRPPAERSDD
jgi:hypothetical protein